MEGLEADWSYLYIRYSQLLNLYFQTRRANKNETMALNPLIAELIFEWHLDDIWYNWNSRCSIYIYINDNSISRDVSFDQVHKVVIDIDYCIICDDIL